MTEAKTAEPGTGEAQQFQAPAFTDAAAASQGDGSSDTAMERPSLDMILDVTVTLSLEVGRAQMSVGELLQLTKGAVIELDRHAGEPLDVFVNGTLVAHGEIVVINDRFGIRLTDVVAAEPRGTAGR
ncbi:MAG: flagellar motor switch protein FliN [Chromatiales bacterium]|nr:flagellar motor switch protein FliN [Chromatiales bacterium]